MLSWNRTVVTGRFYPLARGRTKKKIYFHFFMNSFSFIRFKKFEAKGYIFSMNTKEYKRNLKVIQKVVKMESIRLTNSLILTKDLTYALL